MLNPFEDAIDAGNYERDIELLSLQLEVSKELAASPNIRKYLLLQGQQTLIDIAKESPAGDKLPVALAGLQGQYEVYAHLHYLMTSLEAIQTIYLQKTAEGN